MKCVFLDKDGKCEELTSSVAKWKVDEQTKKNYCTMNAFRSCPRFLAKMAELTKGS